MGKSFEPVRTGVDPRTEKTELASQWLTIKANEAVTAICLVEVLEIIATEQCAIWLDEGPSPIWVYTGEDDPCHDLDIKRNYRAYLPLLVEGEQKVWSMGKTVHMALLDVADAVGSIAGIELRLKRTGAGLSTRYTISQTGKRYDVSDEPEVDVISLLGPLTPEGVREMLCKKLDKPNYEAVVAAYRGKVAPSKAVAKVESLDKPGKPGKPGRPKVVKEEEEDLEKVDLL